MSDCDTTCKAEEKLSTTSPVSEDTGSLKRPLHDGSSKEEEEEEEEDVSSKRLKTTEADDKVATNEKAAFIPNKKKCALLLSYCGAGYNGMQINPGVKTIEEELLNALHKAEAITEDGKAFLGKMVPEQSIVPKINEYLPPEIRLVAMKRATRGFDAKRNCSARTYEYLTPTYAFAKDYQTTANYRVTEEKIEEVNKVFSKYIGTHSYHNFTSGKQFNDASAKRYIMKFKCGKPFENNGLEFISLIVKGQSFMLHQIRKMIGLAVAIVRGVTPLSTFELARKEKKVDIPKAPAVGLVLDQVHFEAYNRRYGDDGIHETMEWDENEEEIQKFKDQFIYRHIIDAEINENVMLRWLRRLPDHTYSDERMEEIHSKLDEDTGNQKSGIQTSNTADTEQSSTPVWSGDMKKITEGGEGEKSEQTEI